jgi:hypothetical protein
VRFEAAAAFDGGVDRADEEKRVVEHDAVVAVEVGLFKEFPPRRFQAQLGV